MASGDYIFGEFGACVAPAGDIDGDGYDDVVVGAPYYQNGEHWEGGAFAYLGSPNGLAPSPAWTGESNQVDAWFASSTARAGDVDGDGKSDLVVGASEYDSGEQDEGAAFVYVNPELCAASGNQYCAANPNSTGSPADMFGYCSASSTKGVLRLVAEPVPDQFGVFFHGMTPTQMPFGNGYLCVTDDVIRGRVTHPWTHVASYRYDNSDAEHSLAAYVGTTRHFQYWFRDPLAGGAFFNTSNAVSIVILP
jgi:hypothetical protein